MDHPTQAGTFDACLSYRSGDADVVGGVAPDDGAARISGQPGLARLSGFFDIVPESETTASRQ